MTTEQELAAESEQARRELLGLTPERYTGNAAEQAAQIANLRSHE